MNTFQSIETWSRSHHPKWMDVFRILLGLTLFIKGYLFIHDRQALYQMAVSSTTPVYTYATIYPRAVTLLVAGILITAGLITRIACLFELPWALGAVIFANKNSGFFSDHITGLGLNILILFLVVLFLIEGSGPLSADEAMKKNTKPDSWDQELDRRHLEHL